MANTEIVRSEQNRYGSTFATPLRYPGGKGRLGFWFGSLLRHNRISGGWYVEPYAGGAGAALYLLTRGYVNHVVINDADPVVHAFWQAALHDSSRFLGLVASTPVTMDSWYRQKAILADPGRYEPTEVGFATFFLNRTNRSGILAGGVIGGKAQTGTYDLSARFNKPDLTHRINILVAMRRHISLYGLDAMELLKTIEPDLPQKCLIYLDPPYYNKGSQLYRNYYRPEDHALIATIVREQSRPWVVTYDDCQPIRDLYEGMPGTEFSLHYSTHTSRPVATEVMYYNHLTLHEPPHLRR